MKTVVNLILILTFSSLLISCATEQARSDRWNSKTSIQTNAKSCSQSSFGNIDVCGACNYSGSCTITLPGGCAVDLEHVKVDGIGNEQLIGEYLNVATSSKTLNKQVVAFDVVRIYMVDDAYPLIECEVLR